MRILSISALTATFLALAAPISAALAGAVTIDAPLHGETLHAGDIDMSVYFSETAGDGFEVVATYVSNTAPEQPARIVMELADGDNVTFGLPGHRGKLYEFSRKGRILTVSDKMSGGEG